jgi:hypothetical protein
MILEAVDTARAAMPQAQLEKALQTMLPTRAEQMSVEVADTIAAELLGEGLRAAALRALDGDGLPSVFGDAMADGAAAGSPVCTLDDVGEALVSYTADSGSINDALRGQVALGPADARTKAALDLAFAQPYAVLKQDITVYRVVEKDIVSDAVVGRALYDRAFMSTTGTKEGLENVLEGLFDASGLTRDDVVVIEIKVRKGLRALDLNRHADDLPFPEQDEILLPRNTRIRIERFSKKTGTLRGHVIKD